MKKYKECWGRYNEHLNPEEKVKYEILEYNVKPNCLAWDMQMNKGAKTSWILNLK